MIVRFYLHKEVFISAHSNHLWLLFSKPTDPQEQEQEQEQQQEEQQQQQHSYS